MIVLLVGYGIYKGVRAKVEQKYPSDAGSVSVASGDMPEFECRKNEWSPPLANVRHGFYVDDVSGREVRYDGDDSTIETWEPKTELHPPRAKFVQVRSTKQRLTGKGILYTGK